MLQRDIGYRLPVELAGTILERIVRAKRREIIDANNRLPRAALEQSLERAPEIRSFKGALASQTPAIIAEIKKASPSAGLIREDFDPVRIGGEYQKSGAAALSVITEAHHFGGNLEFLARLRWSAKIPLLRKDFIIDPYQILEARHAGADAVLLIAALLDAATLNNLRADAERWDMDALVEVHDEEELKKALDAGASLIGVNSRDLRTFEVSLDIAMNLGRVMPKGVLAVAESGIRTGGDLRALYGAGYRGFLIGEHLMRSPSPGAELLKMIRDFK